MNALLTVWRLLDRRQQRRLAVLQALSVVMALSTVGGLAPVLPFFSALADPHSVSRSPVLRFLYESFHFTDPHRFVVALGLAFVVGILIANAVNLLGSLAIDRFAFEVGEVFHNTLFDEYLHREYGFHASTSSALLVSNVLHETGRLTTGILRHGLILGTQIVTIVFIVASMMLLNPALAGVAIVGLGASYGAVYWLARGKLRRDGLLVSREYAKRTRIVNESFAAIKELIILQAQRKFVLQFKRTGALIAQAVVSTFAISQTPRYVLECATVCVLVLAAIYSDSPGQGGSPWIAQLSFMGLAVYRLLPSLQQAFLAIVRIRADRPALESVVNDLEGARATGRASQKTTGTKADEASWKNRPQREVALCDITFKPAPDRPPVLANLTLRIPAGAVIGLVGANGSGKTTLVDVLSGLLVPHSGTVEIDGVALDDTNRLRWQSVIAYVPQNVFISDATVAENVALGVPPEQIDHERVRAAIRLASLEDCIGAFSKGYAELLGERGVRLSGGQRQRLGIARALYRDASLLIMDEPTSALDAGAEREITDMLAARREGRTIILIAHRLASLQHCDRVYELAHGRIVRSGTYTELSADWENTPGALRRPQVVSGANASRNGRL
jgi:ATP-binding cassette, subfamily B, bacterial PglK